MTYDVSFDKLDIDHGYRNCDERYRVLINGLATKFVVDKVVNPLSGFTIDKSDAKYYIMASIPNHKESVIEILDSMSRVIEYLKDKENLSDIIKKTYWYETDGNPQCYCSTLEVVVENITDEDVIKWMAEGELYTKQELASIIFNSKFISDTCNSIRSLYAKSVAYIIGEGLDEFIYNGKTYRKINPDIEILGLLE